MKNVCVIIVLSLGLFSFDLPKSGVKKMDKTLAKLWPEQIVSKNPINISALDRAKLSFRIEENTLYRVSNSSKKKSFAYISKGFGKMNEFDYMVVFNQDLSILKVKVLVYREEQGGEIGSSRWLKQFSGKKDTKNMKFGDDIQNISGATMSARSLTEDLKKVVKQMIELRQKGIV
ncbi:FMN-binding protein [Vicingaceae bacterium]|jgi:Na+-translocating ferredoxin:NAD+ oxidoreductase RnfG subunit|nr:FMN-binding protein [Vicingaceae bacterium]